MVEINGARLLASLRELRKFGATGTGVVRPTFSEVDMAARTWLRDQMADAGLDAVIDGAGNVFGRSSNSGPALVVGSHSDTQPNGGWLDGAMGVMYGIEVARAIGEDRETANVAIDAVAWADEEATYTSCLGSRSFVGELTKDVLQDTNAQGETVTSAIERVGLTVTPKVRFEPDRHMGYLEAHIEQGPHLEETGLLVGAVTSIVGIRGFEITFIGEQNHAGTTPMARRADAGVAMFEFATRAREQIAAIASPTTVWTFGNASVEPGAPSIIPGRARLVLQFRDADEQVLEAATEAIVNLASKMNAEQSVKIEAPPGRSPIAPTHMDDGLRRHIEQAAEQRIPGQWTAMPSAAGHDPMVLSDYLPCAMLFIPSIGGVSHDFAEDSKEEDIITGCQILADAAASILKEAVGH
jgi:N-carbamoyl-L-amino-acid hydrolase